MGGQHRLNRGKNLRIRTGGGIKVDLAVVIPTLNEEHTIGACLEGVGKPDGVEVLVCDGGSSDRTRELAAAAGARVVEGAHGRGPQLNLGARSVAAGRLLFLHADCRLPHGWLAVVHTALDDETTALACFRLHTEPSGERQRSPLYRRWLRVFDLRSYGLGLPYGDQGFALRREVFDRVGGFQEIPLMEDVAMARDCRSLGRIRRLPLEVRTTARRAEGHPLRTWLALTVFPTLFRLGVSPHTLARWYGEVR
jgi:rSAM/selenodomain-associated transferase 2